MRRKNAKLQIRIQALHVPKGMAPGVYLRSLLRAMDTGALPRGVDVELHWRNPETRHGRSKEWQSDSFLGAIADSSAGFSMILRRMLQRRLYQGVQRFAPPPTSTPKPKVKKRKVVKPVGKKKSVGATTGKVKIKKRIQATTKGSAGRSSKKKSAPKVATKSKGTKHGKAKVRKRR